MKRLFLFLVSLLLVLSVIGCSSKKEVRPASFDAKQYLQKANKLIEDEEYDEARRLLLEVKNRDLTHQYAPIAQLKIAETFVKDEDYENAINEYERFLRLYPEHTQAPYAQYQIAMIYFRQIEGPERGAGGARRAMAEFEKLLRLYPRNPYREAAKLRIKKCKNLIAQYEFLVGSFYYKKDSYRAAIGRFEGLVKDFPEFKRLDEVLYLLASSYQELGKTNEAKQYASELINRFPSSQWAERAREILKD